MTVDEVKAALDAAGIEYPADARKPALVELLGGGACDVVEASPAPPVDDPRIAAIDTKIAKLIDYRDRHTWRV